MNKKRVLIGGKAGDGKLISVGAAGNIAYAEQKGLDRRNKEEGYKSDNERYKENVSLQRLLIPEAQSL